LILYPDDRAITKSSSAAFLSALIPQPLLPNAEYRWEKGSKVPLLGVYSPFRRGI
jgi:hypothetical protein